MTAEGCSTSHRQGCRASRITPLVLAVCVASCVNVSSSRTGDRFPPNPGNCELEFRYGGMDKAMQLTSSGAVQVGNITVTKGGDSFDDAMKNRVRPVACEMGGNIVMMGDSSGGSFTTNYSYVSLTVFRNAPAK